MVVKVVFIGKEAEEETTSSRINVDRVDFWRAELMR